MASRANPTPNPSPNPNQSAVRRQLARIFPIYLPYISPTSPKYTSPTSPLHLPYICVPPCPKEDGPPDPRCLSYTHDRDYGSYRDYPPGKQVRARARVGVGVGIRVRVRVG